MALVISEACAQIDQLEVALKRSTELLASQQTHMNVLSKFIAELQGEIEELKRKKIGLELELGQCRRSIDLKIDQNHELREMIFAERKEADNLLIESRRARALSAHKLKKAMSVTARLRQKAKLQYATARRALSLQGQLLKKCQAENKALKARAT